jgi:mannose-1-phosphate guanylyltransferase/mannose-6-phosphate isomerase
MHAPWVVILAGGEGTRVRALTRPPGGEPVPKQFCELRSGGSLFRRALARARALTYESHIVPVVCARHRAWWERDLRDRRPGILLVQQEMRGTAYAVFSALVEIARRDPHAVAIVIPSDNMIDQEARFHAAALRLCQKAATHADRLMLLGVSPERPDGEYGWIVPDSASGGETRRVLSFVEKPSPEQAEELHRRGGLLSTFVAAATVRTLLFLYRLCLPDLIAAYRGDAEDLTDPSHGRASWDFSRDLLAHTTSWQRVLPASPCGWCDLGTPDRLRQWFREHGEAFVWSAPGNLRAAKTGAVR